MPVPMMAFLAVNIVLPAFNAAKIILVFPGKILTLFLATMGMEVCFMYSLLFA